MHRLILFLYRWLMDIRFTGEDENAYSIGEYFSIRRNLDRHQRIWKKTREKIMSKDIWLLWEDVDSGYREEISGDDLWETIWGQLLAGYALSKNILRCLSEAGISFNLEKLFLERMRLCSRFNLNDQEEQSDLNIPDNALDMLISCTISMDTTAMEQLERLYQVAPSANRLRKAMNQEECSIREVYTLILDLIASVYLWRTWLTGPDQFLHEELIDQITALHFGPCRDQFHRIYRMLLISLINPEPTEEIVPEFAIHKREHAEFLLKGALYRIQKMRFDTEI